MKKIARLKITLLFLLLCSLSTAAYAQSAKEDAIDIAFRECVSKDTSSGNINTCAFAAYGKWNKEMDKTYGKLMKALKKTKDKAAMKQSQTAWKAYRDAEFTSYNNMFNYPGSKWCMMRQAGRIDIVRARVLQLNGYLEGMKKH